MTTLETMEQRLENNAALHFLPYIGPQYNAAAPRVLLLGEAAHGPEKAQDNRKFIRDEVRDALRDSAGNVKGNHWVRYVRNMEAMLTGKEYGSAAPVWDQLAYGVFFQRMQTGPAEAHSPEDIRRGRDAFHVLLNVLAPRIVTVWGLALQHIHWLPEDQLTTLEPDIPVQTLASYPRTLIWHCHHPARDFSYRNEHQRWLKVRQLADV